MKRAAIIILLLISALVNISAESISEATALLAARNFFNIKATKNGSDGLSIVWNGLPTQTKSNTDAPFYVITRDSGGFVIVAGDDNVIPILGFSTENGFDPKDMPSNVEHMMDQMRLWCESHTYQSDVARAAWVSATDESGVAPDQVKDEYLGSRTVQWNQKSPFNDKAPLLEGEDNREETGDQGDGVRCAAGCVPVALAEVLAWHGSPVRGDGATLTVYRNSEQYGTVTLDTEYDWTGIRKIKNLEDTLNVSARVIDNLAQLLLDCGALVKAEYGKSTSAYEDDIVSAFSEHMGYSNASLQKASKYSSSEWTDKVVSEIYYRPLLFFGETQSSGHAFVADGYATYQRTDYIHFNFGWGSQYNGYYHLCSHPVANGKDYQYNQSAIFGFYPEVRDPSDMSISLLATKKDSTGLRILSTTPVAKGQTIEVSYFFLNFDFGRFKGRLRLCLEDKAGNIKQVINTSNSVTWDDDQYWTSASIDNNGKRGTITEDVEFGDKIALYYSKSTTGESFERVTFKKDGSVVGEAPCYPVPFIYTESSYSVGDRFQFRLINNSEPYNNKTYRTEWTVTDPAGTVSQYDTSDLYADIDRSGTWQITAAVKKKSTGAVIEKITTSFSTR